jgi:hypothetical protein
MELWVLGIWQNGFKGQIYHEEKLNQLFTAQPIILLLHYSLAQTWHARPELHRLCFGNITAKTTYSRQLAPGQANTPIAKRSGAKFCP